MIQKDLDKINIITEFPQDYTVVDIETTGLSPSRDEIIEISALKIRSGKIYNEFSQLIKPKAKIGPFITHLTGITNEMVISAPKIEEVLPDFINFVSNDIILGHNVKFDLNFIRTNLENYCFNPLLNQSIDTMILGRKYCKLKSHSLKNLAIHYNVSIEGHHRALNDCLITHNIYQNIKKQSSSLNA